MTQQQDPYEDWGSATPWNQAAQPAAPPPPVVPARPPTIQNYMVPAVLVTLLCFLPTGIAALVFASQVSAKLNSGDVAGAMKASSNARTWVIVSVVAGVIVYGIYAVVLLAAAASDPYAY
jgi:Interferon-induced transmembrane protein